MASDGPRKDVQCKFCGKTFKYTDWVTQKQHCNNNPDALMQSKSPGNAQGSIEPSQKPTAQGEQHVNNPASNYAQGGINDAPRLDTPLSADEELAAVVLASICLGYWPVKANPDQVLMTCSEKSSSSAECCGGDERRGSVHPIVGLEEEDLNRDAGCQGVTNRVGDSDVTQKQKRKPDLSTDDLRENVKADTGIHDHGHPSVMQMQNKRLGLNLVPHNNSSDHEVTTLSVSSKNGINSLVPTGTSSDEETKTIGGGVDINNPEHTDSSVTQMQETLGPNLLPHNDSSDHEARTLGVSSMDDLNVQVSTDTNSEKEMKTVNGGQL